MFFDKPLFIFKSDIECQSPIVEGTLERIGNFDSYNFKASYGFGKWNIMTVDSDLTRSNKIGLFVKLYRIYKGNNSEENIIRRVINMDL